MPKKRQSFHEFISEWRSRRIGKIDSYDPQYGAEQKAQELTALASRSGYRTDLTRASSPYRGVVGYVKALYDFPHHRRPQGGAEYHQQEEQ